MAEGQVPAVLLVEVEHVGIGEALGVAVGGVIRQDDRRTGLDGLAAHLDVLHVLMNVLATLRYRSSSSTARSTSAGSARSAASCAGLRSSAKVPSASVFAVVSNPAASRSRLIPFSSSVGQIAVGEVAEHVVGGVRALGGHQLREVVLGRGVGR